MYIILMFMSFGSLALTDPCQGQLTSKNKFDPHLFQSLKERKTVLVSVHHEGGQSHSDILREFEDDSAFRQFVSRSERLQTVVTLLEDYTRTSQRGILEFLNNFLKTSHHDDDDGNPTLDKPVEIIPLWITNKIIVKQASLSLVRELALRPDVSKIEEDKLVVMLDPLNFSLGRRQLNSSLNLSAGDVGEGKNIFSWGVRKVQATKAWDSGIVGNGIVVGVIDTGVRATHEALKENFRLEFGWFDPDGKSLIPQDTQGHGTHTTGSIVGRKGIGVSPSSQAIHCRAMPNGSSYVGLVLRCMQWMACPTSADGKVKDCGKAPHIVSNSWGFPSPSSQYAFDDALKTWRAQGIIPIFSAGNQGNGVCSTIKAPGDSSYVLTVGATDRDDILSSFSSIGPSTRKNMTTFKPDFVAPGNFIVSAGSDSDDVYADMSGTSMACPHVAGVVALMLSKDPTMTFDQVKETLAKTADPALVIRGARNCSQVDDSKYPNYHTGYGRVNALKAVR